MNYGVVEEAQPVLISGVYRSGTTFLAALLGAHPQLVATSSTVKYLRFCLNRYGDVALVDNARRLIEETYRRVNVRWGLSFDRQAVLTLASRRGKPSYASLYDAVMRVMLTGADDSRRWVEKLAMQWRDIPKFLAMFPNGKVIHIFRDPRDTTASYKAMTFEPGYTYLDAAFNCRGAMEDIRGFQQSVAGNRLMAVRAEDIAAAPLAACEELCAFLQIPFHQQMLDPDCLHAQGEDWATNTSFDTAYSQLPAPQSRWPGYMSREEVVFVEMICQPYLSRMGYRASGYRLTGEEWSGLYRYLGDDFLAGRFQRWLAEGKGAQGYRSDPYLHEMKIVFPERFKQEVEG